MISLKEIAWCDVRPICYLCEPGRLGFDYIAQLQGSLEVSSRGSMFDSFTLLKKNYNSVFSRKMSMTVLKIILKV